MIFSSGGLCSGALIQADLILTAAHCVYKLRDIHVSWNDNPHIFETATLVSLNNKADIALVKLDHKSERKPLTLLAKGQRMPEGSPIATIGHPSVGAFLSNPPYDLDTTYLMSTGIVSGVTAEDLISDMSVSPGNSGGPVLNDRGDMIGVVSRKRIDRYVGSIGFSANLNKVYELLENYNAGKTAPLSWKNASSTSKFYLAYSSQALMGTFNGQSVWFAGLSLDVWDRLRFEVADNFSRTHGFQNYALGYKFAFERANHHLIYVTPTVDLLHYTIQSGDTTLFDERLVGYSLSLQASGFPLGLKYTGFQFQGKYYGVTALQLTF